MDDAFSEPRHFHESGPQFLAVGVEKVSGQHLDATEDIDVYLLDQDYVRELLGSNQILQALMTAPLWKYFYDKDK